jgi:hypothetical protein
VGVKLYDAGSGDTGNQGVQTQYWFFCPGCKCSHAFSVPRWTWNGSMEAPTFTPSLMCNGQDPSSRCHTIVTDGKIAFQGDCHHELAGQTVDMPDWEGW